MELMQWMKYKIWGGGQGCLRTADLALSGSLCLDTEPSTAFSILNGISVLCFLSQEVSDPLHTVPQVCFTRYWAHS